MEALEVLAAYEEACASLAPWVARLSAPVPSTPEPQSRLAKDDSAIHGMPTSELIHVGLVTATESLQLVEDTLERTEKYLIALHGPIRTALLGASQAIWALCPADDDVERITRQLWAHREYHAKFAAYLESLPNTHVNPDLIEHEKTRMGQYRALLNQIGARSRRETDTKVIAWASEYALSDRNAVVIQSHWKLLSGDAHALGWPLILNKTRTTESVDGGIVTGVAGPDIEMTRELFQSGVAMLTAAWKLFLEARKG